MPVETISERKRAAILDAALQEFEARGFRETSMDRVAATANVSKRTVYNHFATKSELFDAIAGKLIEHVQQVSDYPYDASTPLEPQLRGIGAQVIDMLGSASFLTLSRVTLVELIRSPVLGRQTYELFRQRQTGLARWLEQAACDGRLAIDDPVWAADQFLGLIKSFAFWPQLLGGQAVPDAACRERILDTSVAMFLSACLPGRRSRQAIDDDRRQGSLEQAR